MISQHIMEIWWTGNTRRRERCETNYGLQRTEAYNYMPIKVTKYYKAYQYEFQNFIMLAVSLLLDTVSKEAKNECKKGTVLCKYTSLQLNTLLPN